MSWRPSDWSPLGLDADPTPGDPVVVRDGGQHYQQVAQALASSAATLRALNGGATTGSQSVAALLEGCEEVLDDITRAYDRYRVAGDALVAYSYSLDRVQATTAQALATARVAAEQADADRRRAASCAASASAAAGSGSKTAESDAAGWNARAAQASADAAYQDRIVDNQKMVVSQAVADRDTAATQASSQIEEITATDGLNDTWWDDWGAKLVAVIADIAEIVSMIAGILALLVCWIPLVGQALAAALLAVAAIAAIVAALANVVLAATGKKSWTDAVISIVFAVLSCIGLGGLRGALGALKAGAAALTGAKSAIGALRGLAVGSVAKGLLAKLGTTFKGLFLRGADRFDGLVVNAAGGRIVTTSLRITGDDILVFAEGADASAGDIHILSGAHGDLAGNIYPCSDFLREDMANFFGRTNVVVHDLPAMSPEALNSVLHGPGTIIAGFCYSKNWLASILGGVF